MRKGFTLLELLIVVIIIGVLAAVAVPQYIRSVERSKVAKCKNALGLITKAEKMYRADWDTYVDVAQASWDSNEISPNYTELGELNFDNDWDYEVTGSDADVFTAICTRESPAPSNYLSTTVAYNENGSCRSGDTGSDHPLRGPDCQ